MARITMVATSMMKMMMAILTCSPILWPQTMVQGSDDGCVQGDNALNSGGSCDFGGAAFTLCDWRNMEGNNNAWNRDQNDVNLSPCVVTHTKDLKKNEIVRLESPLLCATNSSFLDYHFSFAYYIFNSKQSRLSLSVYSADRKKLAELWNTQETTYNTRDYEWSSQSVNVSNDESSFYLIFSIEKLTSLAGTKVALDTLRYTSTPITTTTPPSPTSPTPSPTASSSSSSSTATTTTTTSTTTTSTTTTVSTTTLSPKNSSPATILGLSREVVIAIGVSIGVFIILIIVIAIICRRVRKDEQVKTVSFALASPTAYNVNEDKKTTGKRRREMKARASVLVPSKHSNWEPDHSLY